MATHFKLLEFFMGKVVFKVFFKVRQNIFPRNTKTNQNIVGEGLALYK